jgi:hypothetical protein
VLILSGLIEKDVELVLKRYQILLGVQVAAQIYSLGEWRSIILVNSIEQN